MFFDTLFGSLRVPSNMEILRMRIDLSLDLGAELLELLLLGHREILPGAVILGCLPPAAPAREVACTGGCPAVWPAGCDQVSQTEQNACNRLS